MNAISIILRRAEAIKRSEGNTDGTKKRAMDILDAAFLLEAREAELARDRDYWKGLAMQFHDAVHAEVERRAKVEI